MFEFSEAVREFFSFVFQFLAAGAVGFRLFVLRENFEPEIFARASKRAAAIGLTGAIGSMFLFIAINAPRTAARQHKAISQVMFANSASTIQTVCVFLLVVAIGVALSRVEAGWIAAALAIFVSPLAPLLVGPWYRIVNPLHRLAGGLWIGTLFVLLFAGFNAALKSNADPTRRGEIAANMVHSFSPLALTAFGAVGISGIYTAYRHLKRLDQLWTTPYGYALIAKLCVVAVVAALGAWNWRRQRPLLGTESAARVLRRSATAELAAGTIVLIIAAVLVSLPSPE
jgi:putative copper export protein